MTDVWEKHAEATERAGYGHLLGKQAGGEPLSTTVCVCGMLAPRGHDAEPQLCSSCDSPAPQYIPGLRRHGAPRAAVQRNGMATVAAVLIALSAVGWIGTRVLGAERPTVMRAD